MKVLLENRFVANMMLKAPQVRGGFLVKSDMEKPRNPLQLQEWVDRVLDKMTRPEYVIDYLLERNKYSKEFSTEIFPFNLFVQNLFINREDVVCKPKIGNQHYDAILEVSGQRKRYVEITYKHDGWQNNLDIQFLIENGNVWRGGTRRNDQGELVNEMPFNLIASEQRDQLYKFIKDALVNKCKKNYGEDYILIIAFDDRLLFGMNYHKSSSDDENRRMLSEFAEKELNSSLVTFEAVYLVGMSGKYIIPLKAFNC